MGARVTLRYFGAAVNREGLAGLQLLGRMATLNGVAPGVCPLCILPGVGPTEPKRDTMPAPPPEEAA